MRIAGRIVPGAVPELLYEDRAAGARRHAMLDPAAPAVEGGAAPGRVRAAVAAAVGDRLGRIHAARAAGRTSPPGSRPTPSSTTSGSSPTSWPPPGPIPAAPRAAPGRAAHGHDQARPGPWRRQPEEHPARPGRPGVPRRRVRLVRRSRVRPRLLPQPSAAQVPLDAGRAAGFPRLLRRARARAYLAGVDWEPRRELEARAAALLPGLFLARIDGKSPVEYVTARPDKERVRRVASAFLMAPADDPGGGARGLGGGVGLLSAPTIVKVGAARLGQPRPPDGRGRAASGRRCRRPGDRAGGRLDRQRRGGRPARRRRGVRRPRRRARGGAT